MRDLYDRLADDNPSPTFHLADYRLNYNYEAYVVGEVIEKLEFGVRGSEFGVRCSEFAVRSSRTPNPESRIPNPEQRTPNSESRTQPPALDRAMVGDLYDRLADDNLSPAFHLADYRLNYNYEAYVVGEVIEKLEFGVRSSEFGVRSSRTPSPEPRTPNPESRIPNPASCARPRDGGRSLRSPRRRQSLARLPPRRLPPELQLRGVCGW